MGGVAVYLSHAEIWRRRGGSKAPRCWLAAPHAARHVAVEARPQAADEPNNEASLAPSAKLRLVEFQRININPRLVDATPMSNQTRCFGERMPRQLERRTRAQRVEAGTVQVAKECRLAAPQ